MKRLLVFAALLSFAVPAALAAPPDGKKPDAGAQAAESQAEKACKAERAQNVAAFNVKYGTNKNKKNALGKCVSSKSKDKDNEDEADENEQDKTNAAKECKTERGTTATTIGAFELKYGTNKNKKNAFGKCVSKHAKQKGSSS